MQKSKDFQNEERGNPLPAPHLSEFFPVFSHIYQVKREGHMTASLTRDKKSNWFYGECEGALDSQALPPLQQ